MLENQTIEELLTEYASEITWESNWGLEVDSANIKKEILKRFKQLEEYKSMYEGLEK